MSIKELEEQVEKLLEERDKLEGTCDTLPECQEDDGCDTCKVYKNIAVIDEKVETFKLGIKTITDLQTHIDRTQGVLDLLEDYPGLEQVEP